MSIANTTVIDNSTNQVVIV